MNPTFAKLGKTEKPILEALRCFSRSFHESLTVESDSPNAISWVSNWKADPWKFQFFFNDIRALSSSINVAFRYESKSAYYGSRSGKTGSWEIYLTGGDCYVIVRWVGIHLSCTFLLFSFFSSFVFFNEISYYRLKKERKNSKLY